MERNICLHEGGICEDGCGGMDPGDGRGSDRESRQKQHLSVSAGQIPGSRQKYGRGTQDRLSWRSDSESFSISNILSSLKIPGPIVGPVLDGISNALLTLRIGYVTRSYLLEGQDIFFNRTRRKEIRREALAHSVKALPSVLAEGSKGMGKGVQKIIKLYTKQ